MTRSTRWLASCILAPSAKCVLDQEAKYPIPNTATTKSKGMAQEREGTLLADYGTKDTNIGSNVR
jgi:hypothetical protein